MDIEPLPKVTFLPAQLTELVISNWTGDVIDFEKNGQVSHHDFIFYLLFRFAKSIMVKALASSETAMNTRATSDTASSMARADSNGPMEPSTRVSLPRTRSPARGSTPGQTSPTTEAW